MYNEIIIHSNELGFPIATFNSDDLDDDSKEGTVLF